MEQTESKWRFVEAAIYHRGLDRVIRVQRKDYSTQERFPVFFDVYSSDLDNFRERNKNFGIYTSIFRHDSKVLDGTSSFMGPLYFDFDDGTSLATAQADVYKVFEYLCEYVPEESISIFFTGEKGFHIEIPETVLGVSPRDDLAKVYRAIAETIVEQTLATSIDFQVYDARRMWRMVNSIHQKSGLYKVEVTPNALHASADRVKEYAKEERQLRSHDRSFSSKSNQWYREHVAEYEDAITRKRRERALRRVELFDRLGTAVLNPTSRHVYDKVLSASLKRLSEIEEGGRNSALNKEAFIIYAMAARSQVPVDEASAVLYDAGIAMGLQEKEIEATLESARVAAERNGEENE